MIRSLFDTQTGAFSTQGLVQILMLIPIILISLTLHELAHGYAAYKCGDNTAKAFGRLTLNPISHLDPLGALMIFIVGFGWAKPVPINMRNFRKPRRDLFIVSIAGVVVNFLLAFIGVFIMFGSTYLTFLPENTISTIINFFFLFSFINISLGLFNLIPLPPLDGSKIVASILPPIAAAKYLRLEFYSRYIFLGIIIISWLPGPFGLLSDIIWGPFGFLRNGILSLFHQFANLIFRVY